MDRSNEWYRNGVVYALDVETFADGDGDGIGDFQGLMNRLDYLDRLGVTCVWLLPFYPTPNRDNGYDVTNYYGVDPRLGTLGDFVEFVRAAERRGIQVIVDLVVNHTSDQHPWFQEARRDPDSKYRDFYVWSDEPTELPGVGNAFPGEEDAGRVWTHDEVADAYYYHRFYRFQPELNIANPEVREEIRKIMGFWLELGVDGFRVDAVSLMIDAKAGREWDQDPHDVLKEMRSFVTDRRSDAILLAEADDAAEQLDRYFGDGDEMNLLLNFILDAYLVHALAREEAASIERAFEILPEIPEEGAWANFLRNFDELNLGRLTPEERDEALDVFAPEDDMRIYGRGIRRRLAPMLDHDRDRIELAYSLLFAMPGTPLFFYGDEIGLGEDLSLPGREAVRTPMHWSDEANAGFSTADPEELIRPVITSGPSRYERVNVDAQRADPESLLNWMGRLIATRKECAELGRGNQRIVPTDDPAVFVNRYDWNDGTVLTVHNLSDEPTAVELDLEGAPNHIFGDAEVTYREGSAKVDLDRYGHCWLRIGSESPR